MRLRFYLLFIFFTLLFLFYPGDSYYFHIFSYNRPLFAENTLPAKIKIEPVPYLKNPYFQPFITAQGAYIIDLPSFTPIYQKNHISERKEDYGINVPILL